MSAYHHKANFLHFDGDWAVYAYHPDAMAHAEQYGTFRVLTGSLGEHKKLSYEFVDRLGDRDLFKHRRDEEVVMATLIKIRNIYRSTGNLPDEVWHIA